MIAWPDARRIASDLGAAFPRQAELVGIADAAGRTAGSDIRSLVPLPGHSASAMDGWVVAGDPPWIVGERILAGDAPAALPLLPGTARPIATGGPVPPGARGILRSENGATVDRADSTILERNQSAQADEPIDGEHIRPVGEESASGEVLLRAGTVLTPPRIALAAVAGHDLVDVVVAPTVDLLLLGTEVVTAGLPRPGQVRDAYAPQFPTVLRTMGLELGQLRRVADDVTATVAAILAGQSALVITTGGTANGPADHVREALGALGATIAIDGVGMRPGHPVMLASLPGGRLMLCLPGNPMAAMVGLVSLGVPLVDAMHARTPARPGRVQIAKAVANRGSHTRIIAITITEDGAVATAHQGSGMLRGLAAADGLAVIPPGGAGEGDFVETLPLPW